MNEYQNITHEDFLVRYVMSYTNVSVSGAFGKEIVSQAEDAWQEIQKNLKEDEDK